MRLVLITALLCAFTGGLMAQAAANPLAEFSFTDQKSRSLADFSAQAIAVWGICKS